MTLEFKQNRKFTVEDYAPYIGKMGSEKRQLLPLPNAEDVDPLAFLNNLASVGHMWDSVWGHALPPNGGLPQWAMFFLSGYMMSGCDGGGHAVIYGGQRYIDGKTYATPIVRRFQICRHEKVDGPGANHNRGWHPGHCKLCGYDMGYDSGD